MIEVRTYAVDKARLATLPVEVRSLVLLAGHALNQVTTMIRLVSFANNYRAGHPVEAVMAAGQVQTLVRVLFGMLWETRNWLVRDEVRRMLEADYLPSMTDEGKSARKTFNRIMGSGLLSKLRNTVAFHVPGTEEVEKAFQRADVADEGWRWYLSPELSNSFMSASELVLTHVVVGATKQPDVAAAYERIMDEVTEASNALTLFLSVLLFTVAEKHFGPPRLLETQALHVQGAQVGASVAIPVFAEPPLTRWDQARTESPIAPTCTDPEAAPG